MSEYQEHKSDYQVNFNWGETFNMTVKAPAISNRIFNTFAEAQAYTDDVESNSTEGIRITVLHDQDKDNNGVYYIKSLGDGEVSGVLEKIGDINIGFYVGNAVTREDTSSFQYKKLVDKDLYINKFTLDLFRYNSNDHEWNFLCNLVPSAINYGKYYYKLSRDGVTHPEFSFNTWSETIPSISDLPVADRDGQWFLWTRYYIQEEGEITPKYSVGIISSSLNLGTFSL